MWICSRSALARQASRKTVAIDKFLPRQEVAGAQFAGDKACATCHKEKSRTQPHTPMANALVLADQSRILRLHPRMTFRAGPYSFEIFNEGARWLYRVSDSEQTQTEPLLYAFGFGLVAQTYVFRHNGKLFESRVSFYTALEGLDWTVGDALSSTPGVEDAAGRDISGDEARNCFSCHGTASISGGKLDFGLMTPGVACEACHGPGEKHAVAMAVEASDASDTLIFNPRSLNPESLSQEYCGACHRGVDVVAAMPDLGGVNNVRFQPYRLYNSRGHDPGDPHFACTACHDPHKYQHQPGTFYDAKCATCHAPRGASRAGAAGGGNDRAGKREATAAPSCPVANENCVSCHMPKVELPWAHFQFTDHRIRIARAGEPYPY
jgi:hypothetical protein